MFRRPPRLGFISTTGARRPVESQLVLRVDPDVGVRQIMDALRADRGGAQQITLDMEFAQEGGEGPTPYEVLLQAAMQGNSVPFTRQDGIEETWRIMAPLIEAPPPVQQYAPGSWGPKEGDRVLAGIDRWHGPWVARRAPRVAR